MEMAGAVLGAVVAALHNPSRDGRPSGRPMERGGAVSDRAYREADLWAALTRAPRIDAPDLAALVDNPLAPRVGGLLG